MTRSLARSIAALALFAVLPATARTQPPDPQIGTWVLSVKRSTYSPGPAPKSATRSYTMAGALLKSVVERVGADGKPTKTEYTAGFDGKDFPITGAPQYDMLTLKKLDANTTHASLKKGGKEVAQSHRVVSKNGKSMTVTTTGITDKGEKMKNIEHYDKK